jgi:methanethiol S-methyltransferase
MQLIAAYSILCLAGILGAGSLLAFGVFLFTGPFKLLVPALGKGQALWLDAGLSFLFFIQHSGMIRRPFRRWMQRFIPEAYGSALYAIASGVVLLAVVVCWQESASPFFSFRGGVRWILRNVFLFSVAGFGWGILALRSFDPFGFFPILDRLRSLDRKRAPLVIRGPYRRMRHPLYFFILVMFWSFPDLTPDRLLFNILWSVWVIVGAILEERDLVAAFGDAYRQYQQQVPMLIPFI